MSAAGVAGAPVHAEASNLAFRVGQALYLLGGVLLATTVFLPYPIDRVAPPSIIALVALELLLLGGVVEADRAVARRSVLWGVFFGPVMIAVVLLLRPEEASPGSLPMTTLLLIVPLGVVAGRTIQDAGVAPRLAAMLLAFALGVTAVAVGEALVGRSLFGMQLIVEGGRTRATAGSLHPLVLGLLLCATMAQVSQGRSRARSIAVSVALYAGVLATASDGPVALGAIVLLTALFPRLLRLRRYSVRGVAATMVTVGVLAMTVWKAQVPGLAWSQYSVNYRPAIYALVPEILRERPFGYGFSGLPPGRWVIPTELRGPWDVSMSVDSEVVLLVSEFGLLGLAVFVVVIVWAALWFQTSETPWGLAFFTVVALGLVVALHAWLSVALYGAVVGGIAGGASRSAVKRAREAHG